MAVILLLIIEAVVLPRQTQAFAFTRERVFAHTVCGLFKNAD